MYPSNGMNNFPFKHVPPVWFIQRREYLETYFQELSTLKDRVSRLANNQNVAAVLNAVEALNQLTSLMWAMEDHLESNLLPTHDSYDFDNKGDLRRIRELALATAAELEAIAGKISWGKSAESQISQVTRNLNPLLRLLRDALKWLEQGIPS